eukprot:6022172-Pleurochrysis_carterae.AAC.1
MYRGKRTEHEARPSTRDLQTATTAIHTDSDTADELGDLHHVRLTAAHVGIWRKDAMVKKGRARTRSRSGQSEEQRPPGSSNLSTADTPEARETQHHEMEDATSLDSTPPEAETHQEPEGAEGHPQETSGERTEGQRENVEGRGNREEGTERRDIRRETDGDSEGGSLSAESADSHGR